MTTVRKLCMNDLLDMTHMTFGHFSMPPLSLYMSLMAIHPEYCLVAVDPGNHINGFIFAYNEGEGTKKHCEINEMHYRRPEMVAVLMTAIEERADKIYKVYYVEIDVPSDYQRYLHLFFKLGYTCNKEYYDIIGKELIEKTVLRKQLAGADLHL